MPAFRSGLIRLHVSNVADQTIAAGANDITFDTVDFEHPASTWSGSSFTFDRPGLVIAGARVRRAAVASASAVVVRLRINSSSVSFAEVLSTAAAVTAEVTDLIEVEAGDVFSVGVTAHASISSTLLFPQTRAWLTRVGPKRWT